MPESFPFIDDNGPLDDEALNALADELFQALDAEEESLDEMVAE